MSSANPELILIVDDTPINLDVISDALIDAGFEVAIATSGERMFKQLQWSVPDLILLDVRMPIMNGFEVCQRLKSMESFKEIPIIFMTSLSDMESKTKGFELGAVDYVTKPFQEVEVLARIKTHLQLRRLTKNLEHQVWQRTVDLEKANQQLAEYSLTLENRVEERTAALREAQERVIAQEKLASLGTLTAGVAHELRNPLNFVKNYAEGSIGLAQDLFEILQPTIHSIEFAKAQHVQTLIADLQENATTICRHSMRADAIITSMMQHAHTDNERPKVQLILVNDLLKEAVKLSCYNRQMQDSNFQIKICTDYALDVGKIEAIASNLMRAFINLIDNAYDALHFKHSELASDNHQYDEGYTPTLRISTKLVDNHVEIRIHDNGCGIEPQIKSKILDPFFTTKPPGSGTGLGLSLTHDILVKQHHGSIAIASKSGEFTEIVVTLPLNLL
ncbi:MULTISPECIES: response regulator [Pseudanabaena]|jgi:signal transduction histidine kinase|uniref:hybrid sensor histidine kinase/response regulator n=1 Tax=Pseudanabaena TaxID=1152 RepID=UPI00247AF769|nr:MULTISPECIES: response regulator [Pseudanabaena]MEA5488497.1 response regulator [Pseudanabaena sp. CCNP1317]WGS74299.1 response regulator [Pseudanabaena galeata CCNP1313]